MGKAFKPAQRLLGEILGVHLEEITRETRLDQISCLDRAALIIACEKAFGITIEDEAVCDFQRLADLTRYIQDRLSDGRDDYRPPSEHERAAWYYE